MDPIFLKENIIEDEKSISILNNDVVYYKDTFEKLGGKFKFTTKDGIETTKICCEFPIELKDKVLDTIKDIQIGITLIDSEYTIDLSDYYK